MVKSGTNRKVSNMIKFQIRMYATDENPAEGDALLATITIPPREADTLEEAHAYASRIITPTEGLGYVVVDLEAEAAEEAYIAAQEARGPLAFVIEELDCFQCGGVARKVVALGTIISHMGPTQTYKLACGHIGS